MTHFFTHKLGRKYFYGAARAQNIQERKSGLTAASAGEHCRAPFLRQLYSALYQRGNGASSYARGEILARTCLSGALCQYISLIFAKGTKASAFDFYSQAIPSKRRAKFSLTSCKVLPSPSP